jgi:GT2 family glycosyltransferase
MAIARMSSPSDAGRVRLSAIVVACGKVALLENCLLALDQALARVDGETELIVVLNELSTTGRERLQLLLPAVVPIEGSPSLGFAGAVAAGLDVARGEWIALVNDDCSLTPDALEELVVTGERHPKVGSVAASIRFAAEPDTMNSAGIEIDDLGVARERRLGEPAIAVETEVVEVFGASATLALYRRAMLASVGGLDLSFFAYLEDADLAWRARLAGWTCLLAPRAVGVHHHSSTLGHGSKAKHLLVGRNRVRMLAKNASGRQLRRRLIQIVAYDLLYVAYAAAADRTFAPLVGRLQGLRDWSAYRAAGVPHRHEIRLSRSPGVVAGLRRSRTYRSVPGPVNRLPHTGERVVRTQAGR